VVKVIKTLREQDINPEAAVIDSKDFATREAARAVVLAKDDSTFLLKVGKYNYHKLPGGGIEAGEDIETGLERELLEEIGSKAEILAEIGQIVEYRDQLRLKQISYCFLARRKGEQINSSFDESELAEEFEVTKVVSLDEAINLLEQDRPDDYDGSFIVVRDLFLLKEAKKLINQKPGA